MTAAGVPKIRGAPFAPAVFEKDFVAKTFLGRHLMFMSRPDGVHRILVENAANYERPSTAQRILGPPIGGGLFLAEGAEWQRQRRLLAPSFAPRSIPAFAGDVVRNAEALIARLGESDGEAVALFAPLQSLTLAIAAESLFSMDIAAHNDTVRRLARGYTKRLATPTMLDFLLPPRIPSPSDLPRWRFRRRWMKLIARIVADRRANAPGAPDLFDHMEKTEVARGIFDQQVATLLVTGSETTGAALFWSIYLTASSAEAQQTIAEEATGIDFADPAGAFAKLTYTRAVVQEALRLYPPAFSIVRQALAADTVAGANIPAGAIVETSPWVLHRHRLLWKDPDRFDPGRFLPDATPPERCAYIPFGMGPRLCIGMQFALTETVLVLAMLVQAFRIESTTDQPVKLRARITLQPDDPAPFRLTARQQRGRARPVPAAHPTPQTSQVPA